MNLKLNNILVDLLKINDKLVKSLKINGKQVYLLPQSLRDLLDEYEGLNTFITDNPAIIPIILKNSNLTKDLMDNPGVAGILSQSPELAQMILNNINMQVLADTVIENKITVPNTKRLFDITGIQEWELFMYIGPGQNIATLGQVYENKAYNGVILKRENNTYSIKNSINSTEIKIPTPFVFIKRESNIIYYSTDYKNWESFLTIRNDEPQEIHSGDTEGYLEKTYLANTFPYHVIICLGNDIIIDASREDDAILAYNNKILAEAFYVEGYTLNNQTVSKKQAETIEKLPDSIVGNRELSLFPELKYFINLRELSLKGTGIQEDLVTYTLDKLETINLEDTYLSLKAGDPI